MNSSILSGKRWILALLAIVLFYPNLSTAKLFRNAYVQFDLPDLWDCKMEGTEWVCSSRNANDAKESTIILTAKEVGPQDTFEEYQRHLKTPRDVKLLNGKPVKSVIKNVQLRKINNHQWVDSMHLGSEIPGYYTRYAATVKDKIAILVTLSAHQKFYTKYSRDFVKAVESLRVIASKDLLNSKLSMPGLGAGNVVGKDMPVNLPAWDQNPPPPEDTSSSGSSSLMLAALLLLAVAGLYIWKKRSGR